MLYTREIGWPCVERWTGEIKREQQPIIMKIRLLLFFNPLMYALDRSSQAFRYYLYKKTIKQYNKEASPTSQDEIKAFIDFYGVNMDHFEPSDYRKYGSFREFFVRPHTKESRHLDSPNDDTVAVSTTDSRLVVYDTVAETKRLWLKGHGFTIKRLLNDAKLARIWENGAVAVFRLSPQDYHRYHSPVSGTVKRYHHVPGEFFGVDPLATRSMIDVLGRNERTWIHIESPEFGQVMFIAIGAEDIGKIRFNEEIKKVGTKIKRGDELGRFDFGASSIIVLFEPHRIRWDKDLLAWSRKEYMVNVTVGMHIGSA